MLAGGAARRLPGKALLPFRGRPLICAPLTALSGVLREVVVVAKRPLPGFSTLIEPAEPLHPRCGILHALRSAGGRPVLVCAADMPLIDERELRAILLARTPGRHAAVVPRAGGRLQPLCALYEPGAVETLAAGGDASMNELVDALAPLVLERPARAYTNVNTAAQLAALDQPNVNE
ncbi:MAG: hypothetical protein NVSMB51_09410 [Solirubrobacteraceae bacterium]